MTKHDFVCRYIKRIKNMEKRKYAVAFHEYLRRHLLGEPSRPAGLSFMAAQAVRMDLTELFNR